MNWARMVPKSKGAMVAWGLVALLASAPAWIVKHPPLQDMPFHVATIRVLHDYGDPNFGFSQYFSLNLGRTSYVLYYLVGHVLAYLVGVAKANVLLMSFYLGGTPLALRSLLSALGKDERLALLSLPFLVNVMFLYGFLPYVFGLPLMLWGLAVAVRDIAQPSRKTGVALGFLAVATFYAHMLPFGVFALGYALLFPWRRPTQYVRATLPVLPAIGFAMWWMLGAESGKTSVGVLSGKGPGMAVAPLDQSLPGAFAWTTNIFADTSDEKWFIATVLVAVLSLGLSFGDVPSYVPPRLRSMGRGLALLPVGCLILYFTMGDSLGPVWVFAQRFLTPAILTGIVLLAMPQGARGWIVTFAMLAVGAGSIVNVCQHFIKYELEEVGDLDGAIAAIPPGKKVAGLIYDKGSRVTHHAPFLHYVSYYQAEKGGAVYFSYALSFEHWPFRYKPGQAPPPGSEALRWEWTPERAPVSQLYPYYDYVLSRGSGFRPPPGTFRLKWRGDKWSVYEKESSP